MPTKKFLSKEGLVHVISKINQKLETKADKSELQNISSGGGRKIARIVVGTSTAGYSAGEVDYLCDGTDDQEEINQAIQVLPENGGKVVLLDGVYNIAAPILIENRNNVMIDGSGHSTQLKRMWNSTQLEGIITVKKGASGIKLSNMYLNLNDADFDSANNLTLLNLSEGTDDLIVDDVYGAEDKSSIFSRLQRAVRNGTASTLFPIGTEIPDTWIDTATNQSYQMPLIIAHYGLVKTASGSTKQGVYLMRKNATPFTLQFDAPESSNSDSSRRSYGNNRYLYSNVHQWLNTNKPKGNWWTSQHQYDSKPGYASEKDGYMKGCSPELLSAISKVRFSTQTTNVDGGGIDDVVGWFGLPSLENLNFVTGGSDRANSGVEGPVWDYYKTGSPTDSSHSKRVFTNPSESAQYPWLRSAYRPTSSSIHIITSDGSRNFYNAYDSYAVAPACVIC